MKETRFESFASLRDSLAAMSLKTVETEVLRIAATVESGEAGAAGVRSAAVEWIEERAGARLPEGAAERTFNWEGERLRCEAVRVEDDEDDVWAVRLEDGGENGASGSLVNEVCVAANGKAPVRLFARVLSTVGHAFGESPDLIARLAARYEVTQSGVPLSASPLVIKTERDSEALVKWLTHASRRQPVIALSVPDDADDPYLPLLDAVELARDAAGIAQVAVLPSKFTWSLTQQFSKKLSVYRGAVRIYQPGFDGVNAGDSHWAVMADRLSTPAGAQRHRADILRRVGERSVADQEAPPAFAKLRERAGPAVPATESAGTASPAAGTAGAAGAGAPSAADAGAVSPSGGSAGAASGSARPAGQARPAGEGASALPAGKAAGAPASSRELAAAVGGRNVDVSPAGGAEASRPASARDRSRQDASAPAAAAEVDGPAGAGAGTGEPMAPVTGRAARKGAPPAARVTSATPTAAGSGPAAPATPASGASGPASPAVPGTAGSGTATPATAPAMPAVPGTTGDAAAAPAVQRTAAVAPPAPAAQETAAGGPTASVAPATPTEREPGWFARLGLLARMMRPGGYAAEAARILAPAEREKERLERELESNRDRLDELATKLKSTREEAEYFLAENQDAEARAGKREKQLDEAKARVARLEEQLRSHGHTPLPNGWGDFVGWCERELAGSLVLSPRARREIKGARFADTPLAARCVLWLASEYRDGRLNGAGASLRIEESGIRNEPCGGDKVPLKWGGANRFADWHLKNGGNTRDPTRCLRIYYLWDEETRQVVIASMPAHVRSALT